MTDSIGRPLAERERAVLRHLLAAPVEGVEPLRDQVEVASVEGSWSDGAGPSVDISVPSAAPAAALPDGVVPIEADVTGADGEYAGELLLWLKDGRLCALEYAWVTDEPPTGLPDVSAIKVSAR